MVHLFINNDEIEFNGEPIISYNYDLYGDVLADFTSTYTSSIDIPTTNHNLRVFGFPNISYNDVGSYNFELYNDSTLFDSGTVVVDHVTTDVVSVNLFSSLISISEQLSNRKTFADCFDRDLGYPNIKIPTYNLEEGVWYEVPKEVPTTQFSNTVSGVVNGASNFLNFDNGVHNTSGYLELGVANIGKPSALDCASKFDGTNVTAYNDGIEREFTQTMVVPDGGRIPVQVRIADLIPNIPVNVLLCNMFNNLNGATVSIQDDVYSALYRYRVTLPTFREYSKSSYTYIGPDSQSVSSTVFNNVFPIDGVITVKNYLDSSSSAKGEWGFKNSSSDYLLVCNKVTVTVTQDGNTYSHSRLVYTDGTRNYVRKCPYAGVKSLWDSSDDSLTISEYSQDNELSVGGLTSSTVCTVTVTCQGAFYSKNGWSTDYGTNSGMLLAHRVGKVTVAPTWTALPSIIVCTTDSTSSNFYVTNYFNEVKEPWKLVVDLCKQFNLRFAFNSSTDIQLVLGSKFNSIDETLPGGYYDCDTIIDLSKYLDYSTYNIGSCVFDNKTVIMTPEFNETSWDSYISDNFKYPYGELRLSTNYSIRSETDWFSWNSLKHLATPLEYKYYSPGYGVEQYLWAASQALDTDGNQVQIPYSLFIWDSSVLGVHPRVYVCDEVQLSSPCYYDENYLKNTLIGNGHAELFTMHWLTTIGYLMSSTTTTADVTLFGGTTFNSVRIPLLGFGDIIDQSTSSTLTVNVFLKKLGMSIYDFVRGVYWIENAYYIVSKVTNYNINSEDSCEVTFIKIQDLDNYR